MGLIKNRSKKDGTLLSVAIGNAVSVAICLGAALICPIVVLNGALESNKIRIAANIMQLISGFFGALLAGHLASSKKFTTELLCTGTFIILMIAPGILLFAADETTMISGLLCSMLGSTGALFILYRKGVSTKKRRKKRGSR